MNKRRRAYKKYDWQGHSIDLIGKAIDRKIKEFMSVALQITLIYGRDRLAYDMDNEETFTAGLWAVTAPLPKPYLRKSE